MKRVYSLLYILNVFLLLVACLNHKEENYTKYVQTLDIEFDCEEVLYSEDEGFAVLFKILYKNASDYTILFYKNTPNSKTSKMDTITKGFLLINDSEKENNIILRDFDRSKNFVVFAPKTDSFFYLYMFDRYGKKQLEEELKDCYILYNGGNLKETDIYYDDDNQERVLLFNMKGIKINLDKAKMIPVDSDEELMRIYNGNQ